MHILKGLCIENSGEIQINKLIMNSDQRIRSQLISYTHPNDCGLFRDLSVKEASIMYMGLLLNECKKKCESIYYDIENKFQLKSLSETDYKNTSRGQKQWIQLALSFIDKDTGIVLIDEPLNYLDGEKINIFNNLLKDLKNQSVVFSLQSSLDNAVSSEYQRIRL